MTSLTFLCSTDINDPRGKQFSVILKKIFHYVYLPVLIELTVLRGRSAATVGKAGSSLEH